MNTTTKRGLKPAPKRRSLLDRARGVLNPKPTVRKFDNLDPDSLQAVIRADRIRRRMTWPEYAVHLGVHLSTLHKIATGVHKASELTEAIIRDKLAEG